MTFINYAKVGTNEPQSIETILMKIKFDPPRGVITVRAFVLSRWLNLWIMSQFQTLGKI